MSEDIVFIPGVGRRDWFFEHQIKNLERDLDGALTEHVHLPLEMGADEYIRQLKALAADYSTEDPLPRITADTLVIHRRQDRVVPEEEVEFLADGIDGAARTHRGGGALFPDRAASGVHRGDAAVADALAFHALYLSGRQRAHGR